MSGARLEVSRSHDGHVLVTDAASALGLKWRLSPAAARALANQLCSDAACAYTECKGTIETVGGTRVTFAWPRADVNFAVADLTRHAMAAERNT